MESHSGIDNEKPEIFKFKVTGDYGDDFGFVGDSAGS